MELRYIAPYLFHEIIQHENYCMITYTTILYFGTFIAFHRFLFERYAQLLSEIINTQRVKLVSYMASYRLERRCNQCEADDASWSAYLSSPGCDGADSWWR